MARCKYLGKRTLKYLYSNVHTQKPTWSQKKKKGKKEKRKKKNEGEEAEAESEEK